MAEDVLELSPVGSRIASRLTSRAASPAARRLAPSRHEVPRADRRARLLDRLTVERGVAADAWRRYEQEHGLGVRRATPLYDDDLTWLIPPEDQVPDDVDAAEAWTPSQPTPPVRTSAPPSSPSRPRRTPALTRAARRTGGRRGPARAQVDVLARSLRRGQRLVDAVLALDALPAAAQEEAAEALLAALASEVAPEGTASTSSVFRASSRGTVGPRTPASGARRTSGRSDGSAPVASRARRADRASPDVTLLQPAVDPGEAHDAADPRPVERALPGEPPRPDARATTDADAPGPAPWAGGASRPSAPQQEAVTRRLGAPDAADATAGAATTRREQGPGASGAPGWGAVARGGRTVPARVDPASRALSRLGVGPTHAARARHLATVPSAGRLSPRLRPARRLAPPTTWLAPVDPSLGAVFSEGAPWRPRGADDGTGPMLGGARRSVLAGTSDSPPATRRPGISPPTPGGSRDALVPEPGERPGPRPAQLASGGMGAQPDAGRPRRASIVHAAARGVPPAASEGLAPSPTRQRSLRSPSRVLLEPSSASSPDEARPAAGGPGRAGRRAGARTGAARAAPAVRRGEEDAAPGRSRQRPADNGTSHGDAPRARATPRAPGEVSRAAGATRHAAAPEPTHLQLPPQQGPEVRPTLHAAARPEAAASHLGAAASQARSADEAPPSSIGVTAPAGAPRVQAGPAAASSRGGDEDRTGGAEDRTGAVAGGGGPDAPRETGVRGRRGVLRGRALVVAGRGEPTSARWRRPAPTPTLLRASSPGAPAAQDLPSATSWAAHRLGHASPDAPGGRLLPPPASAPGWKGREGQARQSRRAHAGVLDALWSTWAPDLAGPESPGDSAARASSGPSAPDLAWLTWRPDAPDGLVRSRPSAGRDAGAASVGPAGARGGGGRAPGTAPGTLRMSGLVRALGRAEGADEIVDAVVRHRDAVAAVSRSLPDDVARTLSQVVSRRVLPAAEASTLQATVSPAGAVDQPARQHRRRQRAAAEGAAMLRSGTRSPAGARAMRLSQKLQGLVHLVERERAEAEAHRRVRRASEPSSEGAPADEGSKEVNEVSLAMLQREVLAAVRDELELLRLRSEGGDDVDVWW